jgi:hypothetical protein
MRKHLRNTTHAALFCALAIVGNVDRTAAQESQPVAEAERSASANSAQERPLPSGPRLVSRPPLTGPGMGEPRTEVADSGTNGDIFMTSPWPFHTTGVLLQAKPSWPHVVAKTGTSTLNSAFLVYNAADSGLFAVRGDGRVGIGTVSPDEAKLQVSAGGAGIVAGLGYPGTAANPRLLMRTEQASNGLAESNLFTFQYAPTVGATTTSLAFGAFNEAFGEVEVMRVVGTGAVGIGTSAPARRLHINGAPALLLTNPSTGATASDGFQLIQSGLTAYVEQQEAASLIFRTSAIDRVAIAANGNLGVGTTAPTAKLHVQGDSQFNGNANFSGTVTGTEIRATYQDVAEWVPATSPLEPATVVILNPRGTNEVMRSYEAYDTRVAGVVSAQPGLLLGEAGESKEMIATTGRVNVKVDASVGPIRVGDLLVTSDKPGMAMKSQPVDFNGRKFHQPGTIIGKALEPLDSGSGEILVLLSMQ